MTSELTRKCSPASLPKRLRAQGGEVGPPFLSFVRQSREVLLEHVVSFLTGEDIGELLSSHRTINREARDVWRQRLAELLLSKGEDERQLQPAEEKSAARWRRAYADCYLSLQLYEGRPEVGGDELPWSPGVFEIDSKSFFLETNTGMKLFSSYSGECIRTYVSEDIFSTSPLNLKIMLPLDHCRCLASTPNGLGLSLWNMHTKKRLHGFENSNIIGRSRLIQMDKDRFARNGRDALENVVTEVWNVTNGACVHSFSSGHVSLYFVRKLSDHILSGCDSSGVSTYFWDTITRESTISRNFRRGSLVGIDDDRFIFLRGKEVEVWSIVDLTHPVCEKVFTLDFFPHLGEHTIGINQHLGLLASVVMGNHDVFRIFLWNVNENGRVVHELEHEGVDRFCYMRRMSNISYAIEFDDHVKICHVPIHLLHQSS